MHSIALGLLLATSLLTLLAEAVRPMYKTRSMPCCTETIGAHACMELRYRRPYEFRERCRNDADFGMLQCCRTCDTNVAQLGRELFAHGHRSRHCYDRHTRRFCQHFVQQSGMWAGNHHMHMSCNGESATLAFRICRRSCGFCDLELYQDKNKSDKCPRGGHRRKGNETSTARPDEFIGGAETWTSESPAEVVEGNITEFPTEIEMPELPPELVAELEKELEKEEKELEKEEEEIEPKEEKQLENVEEEKTDDNVEI